MADYYNSEGYASPTEHEAFTRIEREEKAAAKAAAFRPVVYICSPYSGDTERNVENAKRYSRFAVDRHYLPITPHIYFTQFMDDNIPDERDTAIFMNWVLMSKCVELWVFGDTVSSGMNGNVCVALQKLYDEGKRYDRVIAIGPMIMMKFVCQLTEKLQIPTIVSMNPIMVDGTGMCGACRLMVGGEVKFACVDGPEFDGHKVDFPQAMQRMALYKTEEGRLYLEAKEGDTHHGGCGNCN